MKLYYLFEEDILCIVEGNKIWKYVGEDASLFVQVTAKHVNKWYRAKKHPESEINRKYFKLIGEL